MSSIIPGTDFQRYTSNSPVASLGELVFHGQIAIPTNFSSELALPVTFTDSPLHALGRYGRKVRDTFLTLKYISVSTPKSLSFTDKHRPAMYEVIPYSFPGSSTGALIGTFNSSVNGSLVPTFFYRIVFTAVSTQTNFKINSVMVKEHNLTNYYDLGQAFNPIPNGTIIDVRSYFDQFDGLLNFSTGFNAGFDIEINATNTNVGAETLNVNCYGGTYQYDWIQMLVTYQDWQGNIYNAGVFDDVNRMQTFPLGQQVQASIINPAQLQFGQVLFDPINFNSFFNTGYTYDVVLSASIDVFLG